MTTKFLKKLNVIRLIVDYYENFHLIKLIVNFYRKFVDNITNCRFLKKILI